MSSVVQVISKEGKNVEFSVEVANTSKYLQTVLKEDPEATEIQTTIPYNALVIAKQFCRSIGWKWTLVDYHLNKPMAKIPKPLTDYQNFRNNIEDGFDSDLMVNLNRDETFDLLYTAQILQNESLVSLW